MNYEVEILTANSVLTAGNLLKTHANSIDLILVDDDAPKGSATRIGEQIRHFEKVIPMVGIVSSLEFKKNWPNHIKVFTQVERKDLPFMLNRALRTFMSEKPRGKIEENEYMSMSTDAVFYFSEAQSNYYLKLAGGKYLKIFSKGDHFGSQDIQKYKTKKVDQLFIMREEADTVLEKYVENFAALNNLNSEINSKELESLATLFQDVEAKEATRETAAALAKQEDGNLPFEEGEKVSAKAVNSLQKVLLRNGMNQQGQYLIKAVVKMAINSLQSAPELKQMLLKITAEGDKGYVGQHSLILANLSCVLARMMGLSSNLTYYKLILAAILHDVEFDNEELASLRTIDEIEKAKKKFSPAELQFFLEHPVKAALLVNNFRSIPPDVNHIIMQHHERGDGRGFPHQINFEKIFPLSAIFIVSHDLVSFLFKGRKDSNKEKYSLENFLNLHRDLYKMGTFAEVMKLLESF